MYDFVQPAILSMGAGSLKFLERYLGQMDPSRILIVTGPHVRQLGILDRALKAMGTYKGRAEFFINPAPEPDVAVIDECARIVRERKFDLIVGIGGGSPMDVAKGAAVVAVHEGGMKQLLGRDLLRRKGIPVILVPTTAGSGTEVTQACVAHVPEEGTKKSIWDRRIMAEIAVVDAELTVAMPSRLTAETGLDALVHAIEGHTSCHANPLTRMYTREALGLIARYLLRAYRDGLDIEAREGMARAATLAAMGMTNSGLGAIHALALGLEPRGFTHCQSLAVLAPWVMHFNRPGHEALYGEVGVALGCAVPGSSPEEASRQVCDAVLRLIEEMQISPYLKDYGIKKEEINSLAQNAHRVGQRLMHMNIRPVGVEDCLGIFQEAYGT